MASSVHAVAFHGKYSVRYTGKSRSLIAGLSKGAAWEIAKILAAEQKVPAYFHDSTGRVVEVARP